MDALNEDRPPAGARAAMADADAQPGALRGKATIVLHTRHAQRLYLGRQAGVDGDGRKVAAIPGVLRFASQVRQVAVGARAGDPYADWTLIRIERTFATVMQAYAEVQTQIDRLLSNCSGISIEVALSVRPLEVPLQFGSPYAFKAAEVVACCDTLARGILTAIHTARIGRSTGGRMLEEAKSRARHFLLTPCRYSFSGASRDDFLSGNQRAAAAAARFGPLPDEVLQRHIRPSFSVEPPDAPSTVIDDTDEPEDDELSAAAD